MESCSPEAGEFFKKVIDQAQIRGHNIYWGTLGFSVRAYLPNLDRYISFVYGFPVDDFQFYLGYLPLPENELYSLRQEMLNFGIFREGGKKTLKSKLTGDNLEKAPLVYSFILDMMDKIIKK